MDTDRNLRFLYPPVIFMISVSICLFTGGAANEFKDLARPLFTGNASGSILVFLSGAIILFALGYLLNSLTFVAVYAIYKLTSLSSTVWQTPRFHDPVVRIPHEDFKKIKERVGVDGKRFINAYPDRNEKDLDSQWYFYVMNTSCHDTSIVDESMRNWMERRWNACMLAINCIGALVASIVAPLLVLWIVKESQIEVKGDVGIGDLYSSCFWYFFLLVFILSISFQACMAWNTTRGMHRFFQFMKVNKVN